MAFLNVKIIMQNLNVLKYVNMRHLNLDLNHMLV